MKKKNRIRCTVGTLAARLEIRNGLLVLVCLLAAVLVFMPNSSRAQCPQWYVGGVWEIEQRGLKYNIVLTLQQTGKVIRGTAGISTNKGYPAVKVEGAIEDDSISLQINWLDGSIGIYTAKFLSSGRLDGTGYEKKTPHITHIWQSRKQFKCPPPASFNVPLNTYKGKPKPVSPSPKPKTEKPPLPPPPMKVPGIISSQVVYTHPSASVGFVVLTWDAGPDNPYAEVWYSVNNGPEVRLLERGKGSQQMPAERGKLYKYILTDAGKILSTVSFVAQ